MRNSLSTKKQEMEASELGKMKDEMGEGEKIKEIVEKRSPKVGLRIKEKQKF